MSKVLIMYSYGCLPPGEGVWIRPQPLSYSYAYPPVPLRLPPIQAHNFCSRPAWAAPREFHCFYAAGAPWWAFLPPHAAAFGVPGPAQQAPTADRWTPWPDRWTPWPEDSSLQAELRWGRVQRTRGPRLPLPDGVLRELRRVYGTYPRTDVRVTHRRGEFLLDATPHVGEPEHRAARRVLRRPDSGDSGDSGASRAGPKAKARERPKKRKGLG